MTQSADNQPNDRFGYSCYTIVVPAPDDLDLRLTEVKKVSGQVRAMIPAHVTLKGTFYGVADLENVTETARSIVESYEPFFVSFDGAEAHWGDTSGGLRIVVTPELQKLHDTLVESISPLGHNPYRDDPYSPHMTFLQEVSVDGMERGRRLIEETELGSGFRAWAVDLMGRVGRAHGGEWQLVERFRLGG